MGVKELLKDLEELQEVFLDTNVFIYHIGAHPVYSDLTSALLREIEQGRLRAVTTAITLAELLVLPARLSDEQALLDYEAFLINFPNLVVAPVDTAVAREAARIRAETRLPIPDAIQLAVAQMYGVDALLSNDRHWRSLTSLPRLLYLSNYAG